MVIGPGGRQVVGNEILAFERIEHSRRIGDERFRLGAIQAVAYVRREIGEGVLRLLDDTCGTLVRIPRDPDHAGGIRSRAAEQRLLLHHDHVETVQAGGESCRKAGGARSSHQDIASHRALVNWRRHLA